MIMEWNNNNNNHEEEQHNHNQQEQVDQIVNNGVMYVKVMTDEQLETLRKQIAVYATICDQLVEMHKNLTAQQDLAAAAGGRLGNIYCDSFITSATPKITARQRWTPTPTQLQILERIFDQGNGTPTKQKIKDITSQLTQHGPISETNVYNWFQNRRARSKRKQVLLSSTNADSELDQTEVDSLCQNKVAQGQGPGPPVAHAHDLCFHSPEITSSDMHFLGVLSNQKDDPLSKRMGITGSYNLYDESDEYGMA